MFLIKPSHISVNSARCYVGTEYRGSTTQCSLNDAVCSKVTLRGRQPVFLCSTYSSLDSVGYTAYVGYELNCQNVAGYGEICACNGLPYDECNKPRKR